MIILYGWDSQFYEEHQKKGVMVVSEEELPFELEGKNFLIQTPLQIEILARKLAWETVFEPVEIHEGEGGKLYFEAFRASFERCHLAADLLLSDAADYGVAPFKNAYLCRKRKCRSIFSLEGKFKNIPAIIVGAGPSLSSLQKFEEKALIFAGGSALDRIDVKPHFAASIDKVGPLKNIPPEDVPFCFQSRLDPKILSQIQSPLLRAPESHFSFLQWLEGEKAPFDGGWTVGNFQAALALLWGCNPIVFVGMDFCYREGRKYAGDETASSEEGLVESIDSQGKKVKTQRDWLMAVHWMNELAKKNPHTTFIDGSGEGLGFSSPILVNKELDFPLQKNLRQRVDFSLQSAPFLKNSEKKWKQWVEGLEFSDSLVKEKLLDPLWEIWRPIFKRAVKEERELQIHQSIFFEQVRKEYLHALS